MRLLSAHMTLGGGGTARGHLLGRRVPSRDPKAPARPSDFGGWELGLPSLFLQRWELLPFTRALFFWGLLWVPREGGSPLLSFQRP